MSGAHQSMKNRVTSMHDSRDRVLLHSNQIHTCGIHDGNIEPFDPHGNKEGNEKQVQ